MSVLARLRAAPPRRGSIVVARINGRPRRYLPTFYSEGLRTLVGEARMCQVAGSHTWAAASALADQVKP